MKEHKTVDKVIIEIYRILEKLSPLLVTDVLKVLYSKDYSHRGFRDIKKAVDVLQSIGLIAVKETFGVAENQHKGKFKYKTYELRLLK